MLSFQEYQIDEELLNLPEHLQENFIQTLLNKLEDHKKKEIQNHIKKVNNSTNPDELEHYSDHPHFAVRLAVAKNKHTNKNTLNKLKSGHSEYKSVSQTAENQLKKLYA